MKRKYIWLPIALCTIALTVSNCGKDSDSEPEPPGGGGNEEEEVTVNNVTYDNFVGGLFQSRCSQCHTGNGAGVAQWTFSGYTSVNNNLERINNVVVVTRVMPQGGSLSARQIELLKAWIDKDAPQN